MPRSRQPKYGREIVIDWKAYYKKFCELHGGDPVEFGGRLLFQDAWQYHLTNNEGPEWMPPDDPDEVNKLQITYWSIRKQISLQEFHWLKSIIETLQEAGKYRSAPLQHKFIDFVENDEGRIFKTLKSDDLDLKPYLEKLNWYRDDVRIAEQHIKDLETSNATAKV